MIFSMWFRAEGRHIAWCPEPEHQVRRGAEDPFWAQPNEALSGCLRDVNQADVTVQLQRQHRRQWSAWRAAELRIQGGLTLRQVAVGKVWASDFDQRHALLECPTIHDSDCTIWYGFWDLQFNSERPSS